MAKWVGWIAYLLWGLLCFFCFLYLLFPYEAVGRRVLRTLEQKASLVTRSSKTNARFFGIQWDRVELSFPRQGIFPPIEIRNWVIQLRPLSLLAGRISVTSHGAVMGGVFHTNFVTEKKGRHGFGECEGLRIDRFPLSFAKEASLGGIASGRVLWQMAGQRLDGEASFDVQRGRIQNIPVAGLTIPLLNLGRIKGQITWKGEKIDLKEISSAGGDLKAKLTGSVFLQNPLPRSRMACRLEIGLAKSLLNRYPVMKAFSQNSKGQPRSLVMTIRGTLDAPELSLTR